MSDTIKTNRIERKGKCKRCKGTGLYVGLAERDGAAVVCHTCKGTGCFTFVLEWEEFDGRASRPGVERVYEINPGIVVGKGKDGEYQLQDFGGMPYEDWCNGEQFPPGSENRRFTCPAWWYQSADYKKKPDWDECVGIGSFSRCHYFNNREECWRRFDAEQEDG